MLRRKTAILTAVVLALNLVVNASPSLAQKFVPPSGLGLPGRREGAGTRSGCLQTDAAGRQLSVVALMPETNVGLTTMEHPTFFWYVPRTDAKSIDFTLNDEDGREVYKTTYAVSGEPGIMSISLPNTGGMPPLEMDKAYQWRFSLVCLPGDPTGNVRTSGWVKRVRPSADLASRLQKAAAKDRPGLYAAAGIWQDTLATLSELRRATPNDQTLADNWSLILESVKLDKIAKDPLVQCCQPVVRNIN